MRYALFVLTIVPIATQLSGQTSARPDLNRLDREIEDAVRRDDLIKAADLASTLDDGVQRQFRAWLNRDANQRVNEVLNWLPKDIEALWVLRDPIIINPSDSSEPHYGIKVAHLYAVDRLMALNGGQIYRRLQGKTIRLVVAAIRKISSSNSGIAPAFMPDGEVAYFYLLEDAVDEDVLGVPDESINKHSFWRGTAKIDAGESWGPQHRERAQREDESWLTFARPNLLVLSSRREMLIEILGHVGGADLNPDRALPESLVEWGQVDRQAQFWGLRHYSEPGLLQDAYNPKNRTTGGVQADALAIGVTVRFDFESGNLEIRYSSPGATPPRFLTGRTVSRQFQTLQLLKGVWQLKSNTRDRGDFPFHFAAALLGFGGYR
jgi:hypothetical protein